MDQLKGYYEANKTGEYLGFPVTVIAMNVMYNGLHWHDHGEILYCRKGQIKVRIEGGEHILEQGEIAFINGGESHEICDGHENELQIAAFIDQDIIENMEEHIISFGNITEEDTDLIREALEQMAYLSILDPADDSGMFNDGVLPEEKQFRYLMYMYQLLMVLAKYKIKYIHPNSKKNDVIKRCVDYINDHLGDELNAKVLAAQFHVSQATVYRLFSEKIGLPLGQYITTVRVNAVCRCLEETDDKISNIAMNCGFTGLSNFYRVFQLQVGMSPKEYRLYHRTQSRKHAVYQPEIMKLNRYQTFSELGISPEELLSIKSTHTL